MSTKRTRTNSGDDAAAVKQIRSDSSSNNDGHDITDLTHSPPASPANTVEDSPSPQPNNSKTEQQERQEWLSEP